MKSTLEIDGLTVKYPRGPSVGPFSLRRDAGILHLVGSNGSGKTTLLRAIAGIIPLSSGSIRVGGLDPVRDPRARALMGYVATRPLLPAFLTIDESWQMMATLRGNPDWRGLEKREELGLPGNLQLGRASSGMRRKAELLAALAGDPSVLLLDETLTTVDVEGVDTVCRWLTAARNTHTVLLTHHGVLPFTPCATVFVGDRLDGAREGVDVDHDGHR